MAGAPLPNAADCAGADCPELTTSVATAGLCLDDGTPIAAVVTRDCNGVVTEDGWIDLTTGIFTAGPPPPGTSSCSSDNYDFALSGWLCDILPDGSVAGIALVQIERDPHRVAGHRRPVEGHPQRGRRPARRRPQLAAGHVAHHHHRCPEHQPHDRDDHHHLDQREPVDRPGGPAGPPTSCSAHVHERAHGSRSRSKHGQSHELMSSSVPSFLSGPFDETSALSGSFSPGHL